MQAQRRTKTLPTAFSFGSDEYMNIGQVMIERRTAHASTKFQENPPHPKKLFPLSQPPPQKIVPTLSLHSPVLCAVMRCIA
jgi:hypothetical protein